MADQHPEGGAANTPPFPNLPETESAEAGPAPAHAFTPSGSAGAEEPASFAEESQQTTSKAGAAPRERASDHSRGRAARRPNPIFARIADQLEELAERINEVAYSQSALIATPQRGAALAGSAADTLVEAADYLRGSTLTTLQQDLAQRVEARPYQTLGIAFGTGWILGKVLR